jgi:hypothetical protein
MHISDNQLNLNHAIILHITPDAQNLNCLDLLVAYVHKIVATNPAPYTLFVSGGVDSQAMVYAWHISGVEFSVCHVDYMGFNFHDVKEIYEFCARIKVEITTITFNLLRFLENDLSSYAMRYQCASPQICTHMAFSELVDGTPVFSGNLPTFDVLSMDNTIFGLQRYATISGRPFVPFFLLGDELASLASIANSKIPSQITSSYAVKCQHYENLGFPIIRQTEKMTGFEHVKSYYDVFPSRVTVHDKIKYSHLPSKRVFDQIFRNKYLVELQNHFTPYYKVNYVFP